MHKGYIVKCFRLQSNLTQEFMADSLNMSQANYSKKENCQIKFSDDECEIAAKLLNIPVSYIIDSYNELVLIPKNKILETESKEKILALEKRIKELEIRDEANNLIILNLSKQLTTKK